jgi:mannose-1-phosphate guanylyltransferase
MYRHGTDRHRWGVILAGGDGVRLRPVTRLIAGDDRPKQFCPLFNGRTLFHETRLRVARRISVHRTVFVVNQRHQPFYNQEIGKSGIRTVVQPSNRGTLPAILWSVLRVARLDPLATIALFPSDHYYADEDKFMEGVGAAFQAAEADPESVVLLGARASQPETSYGWIEPDGEYTGYSGFTVHRINRFWEKPPLETAQSLLEQDCLWNTFVMVGRADAFLKIIGPVAPRWADALLEVTINEPEKQVQEAAPVYADLPPADFSCEAVSANIDRFAVLRLGETGWSDLGDPVRLLALTTALERKPATREYAPVLAFARAAAE